MSEAAHALIDLMARNADGEYMTFDDRQALADGSVCLRVENCERDFDKLLAVLLRGRPVVVEYVGESPWDDGGGWTAEYVVGCDGFLIAASHSMPSYSDDEGDACLTFVVQEVAYPALAAGMAKAVRTEASGLHRVAVSKLSATAPDEVLKSMATAAKEMLPAEIDGVDVAAFLSKLGATLAGNAAQKIAAGVEARMKLKGVTAAAERRKRREARLAVERAARAEEVDQFLSSIPAVA